MQDHGTVAAPRVEPARRALALALATMLLLVLVPVAASSDEPAHLGPRLQQAIASDPLGTHTAAVALDDLLDTVTAATFASLGLDHIGFENFPVAVVRGPSTALAALEFVPGVRSVWLDHQLEQVLAESRVVLGVDTVQADLGYDGTGVGIAVIDSGIEATHADLEYGTKTIQNVEIVGAQGPEYDGPLTALAVPLENVPDTDNVTGHGTHVAGIAAGDGTRSGGRLRGVASGADLVGIGAGEIYLVTTLASYDWLLSNADTYGVRVLNNSWADGSIPYDPAHPLNLASRAAYDAGIVVVQAAGNDGQGGGDVYNRYAAPEWVLGVGGVDKLGRLASYSSRGAEGRHVDVMAVGSYIASTMATTGASGVPNQLPFDPTDPANPRFLSTEELPYYTYKAGTSMAAPHVAGIAALVLQAEPTLTPDQVMDAIIQSATPVPGCAAIDCGYGLVNAVAAIEAAHDLAAPPLVAPMAALAAAPAVGEAPLGVTLDASGSSDADGTVVAYEWDVTSDGEVDVTTSVPTITHTYEAGRHTASVTVVDDDGLRSVPAAVEVVASNAPEAAADVPEKGKTDQAVTFDASASTDPDGTIVSYTFDLGDGTVVEQSSPVLQHTYSIERPERFVWVITVTDDAGVQDAVSGTIKITPGKANGWGA